jgi:hypothetical protein
VPGYYLLSLRDKTIAHLAKLSQLASRIFTRRKMSIAGARQLCRINHAHDHARAFRYHVLDDKTEIKKALPQG